MSKRLLVTFAVVFVIIPALARAGGGGGYDEGCGCGDSCGRSSYDYEPPKPIVDKSAPPSECLPYLDLERRAAYTKAKTELICPVSADDLAKLKAANERLEQENAELKAKRSASVVVTAPSSPVRGKNTVLIRMVKVKRGWSLGYIVEKYRAQFKADLDATVVCNGFRGANQTIYPRQIIKVCRWK